MKKYIAGIISLLLLCALFASPTVQAAGYSANVKEAQTILTKFGIPAGPIDGYFGPQTARGLCAFRQIAQLTVNRNPLDSTTLAQLRSFNATYANLSDIQAPIRKPDHTYLYVNKTCQAMIYVENARYIKVMAVSTGMAGFDTPNSNDYHLGNTIRGWHCSNEFPTSCTTQTQGRFAYIKNYGNMYNRRYFTGNGVFVHGSTSVPTYPASHKCVRVTIADSDWMYDHVGNYGAVRLIVAGRY